MTLNILWSFLKNTLQNQILSYLTMVTNKKIKDEKLQYYINKEAAKISALSSGKFDKHEYFTGEEI